MKKGTVSHELFRTCNNLSTGSSPVVSGFGIRGAFRPQLGRPRVLEPPFRRSVFHRSPAIAPPRPSSPRSLRRAPRPRTPLATSFRTHARPATRPRPSMPYLPPHLRDGGGSGSDSDGGRGGGGRAERGPDRYDDRRGGGYDDRRGGGYDDRRGGGYDDRRGGGYDDRRGGDRDRERGGPPGGGGGSGGRFPKAVFADYKPSARVQALTVNQVRRAKKARAPRRPAPGARREETARSTPARSTPRASRADLAAPPHPPVRAPVAREKPKPPPAAPDGLTCISPSGRRVTDRHLPCADVFLARFFSRPRFFPARAERPFARAFAPSRVRRVI